MKDRKELFMNDEKLSFVMYTIYACSSAMNILPSDIYAILKSSECIDNYLLPCYDVLHTMGRNSIVEDVREYLARKGFAV